jgi:hypothetical protein
MALARLFRWFRHIHMEEEMRVEMSMGRAKWAARGVAILLGGWAMAMLGACLYKSSCDAYADDLYEKLRICGLDYPSKDMVLPPMIPLPRSGECTDRVGAEQESCFDACLPKLDCGCSKDPNGDGCWEKTQPYKDCIVECAAKPE